MIIKKEMTQVQIAKIRKGDIINLILNESQKVPTEIKVKVMEIVSDIQKCKGCGCRLDNKQSFDFRRMVFCEDCYKRRVEEQRTQSQMSSDKRKKQKPYWNM